MKSLRFLFLLGMLFAAILARADITLRFTVWDGDESSNVLKKELAKFEAANPGVKVKFERSDFAQYFDKLLTQYAAGVAPDVVMMDPANFQRFARRGALLELNKFYGDVPGFDIKGYYPSIVKAHSIGDSLYVLPRDIAPIAVVYYNKTMFEKEGIAFPSPDWTWDFVPHPQKGDKDFLTVLKKFQKLNEQGKPKQWGYVPGWNTLLVDLFFFSTGGRYVDDPEDPKVLKFDDPRLMKAYQFVSDLTLKDKVIPSSFDQAGTNARQMFTQGKVAMFHSGIWETPQLRKEISPVSEGGFEWDVAIAPAFAGGTRAYPTGGSGYGIMSSTKHPKEAWRLSEWMAGKQGMLAMAKAGIAQPAIRKYALMEPWIPGPNTPAEQQVPANRIITDQAEPFVVFPPTGILYNEAANLARQPEALVYTGDARADAVFPGSNKIGQNRLDVLRRELDLPPFNWTAAGILGILIAVVLGIWIYAPEFGKRRTSRQKRENLAGYLFIMPWLFGLTVFTAGPMILSLLMSFADWDIIQPARWRGFGNYTEAATVDPVFWKSLSVTLIYTLVSVPAGIVISLILALLLNMPIKGIPLWRTCYYIPAMASPIAGSLIWIKLFQPEGGLLNAVLLKIPGMLTLLGPLVGANGQVNWLQNEKTALPSLIIMSLFGAGGGMVILLASLQGVPTYYYEAATLDGANAWRKFKNVTIPMISPALFFSLITGFIGSFQVFTQAFQMTQGGPNNATMFFMLHLYNNAFRILRMGYASALAWVLFFVILIFTFIQLQGNKFVYYEGSDK